MWLEHVYGYAGMLDYTLQSNIYYTHNTGRTWPAHWQLRNYGIRGLL